MIRKLVFNIGIVEIKKRHFISLSFLFLIGHSSIYFFTSIYNKLFYLYFILYVLFISYFLVYLLIKNQSENIINYNKIFRISNIRVNRKALVQILKKDKMLLIGIISTVAISILIILIANTLVAHEVYTDSYSKLTNTINIFSANIAYCIGISFAILYRPTPHANWFSYKIQPFSVIIALLFFILLHSGNIPDTSMKIFKLGNFNTELKTTNTKQLSKCSFIEKDMNVFHIVTTIGSANIISCDNKILKSPNNFHAYL